MKTRFLFISIYTTLFCSIILPQDTLPLLQDLVDPSIEVRLTAINSIVNDDLSEYIPHIEDLIWKQSEPFMMLEYLYTCSKFDSPHISDLTYRFIEIADNFNEMFPPRDPLEMKVRATEILVYRDDYSLAGYAFALINRDKPKVDIFAFRVLEKIIKNHITTFEIQAKNEFIYISENCPDEYFRYFALQVLAKSYDKEFTQKCVDALTNSSDFTLRLFALEHLFILEYPDLNNLLKQRLPVDPEPTLRIAIADSILKFFSEPADLKFVKDYVIVEQDPTVELLISYAINKFIPRNHGNTSITEMMDRLNSYTDQLFQFGWIKNENDYTQYKEKTKILRELFEQKKFSELCSSIDWIISQAQSQHGSDSLTEEGYKFLFYYTSYIKEKIETEFGTCK